MDISLRKRPFFIAEESGSNLIASEEMGNSNVKLIFKVEYNYKQGVLTTIHHFVEKLRIFFPFIQDQLFNCVCTPCM